jgi:hypothetical protein
MQGYVIVALVKVNVLAIKSQINNKKSVLLRQIFYLKVK